MALIQCKDCKTQVSNSAKVCPSCGAPVPKPTSRIALFIAGIFGLAVFSSIFNHNSSSNSAPINQSAPLAEAKPALDCLKNEAQILEFINSRINDFPNSALEVLRPCAKITSSPTYIAKIAEAEKAVKVNQDKETQRLLDMEKQIKIDAKAEAKLKKTKGVVIGMSMDDAVASSWGKPRKINRTIHATTVREQWVYNGGYLYFTDGVLTSIQN